MGQVSSVATGSWAARNTLPRAFVDHHFAAVTGLIWASVSSSTWTAYEQVWLEWCTLVSEVDGCYCDEDRLYLLLYSIGINFERGVSVSLLNRKMSGLSL